jgi:hypothetical protein
MQNSKNPFPQVSPLPRPQNAVVLSKIMPGKNAIMIIIIITTETNYRM